MLEHTQLWLAPWSAVPAQRIIADANTRQPLGIARWRPLPDARWRRWLNRPALEVLESEDESLLCLLQRSWGFRSVFAVLDADGRYVGSVRGASAEGPFGRTVAMLVPSLTGTGQRLLTVDGHELATLCSLDGGWQLGFGPALEGNPFARMLLLALALRCGD